MRVIIIHSTFPLGIPGRYCGDLDKLASRLRPKIPLFKHVKLLLTTNKYDYLRGDSLRN